MTRAGDLVRPNAIRWAGQACGLRENGGRQCGYNPDQLLPPARGHRPGGRDELRPIATCYGRAASPEPAIHALGGPSTSIRSKARTRAPRRRGADERRDTVDNRAALVRSTGSRPRRSYRVGGTDRAPRRRWRSRSSARGATPARRRTSRFEVEQYTGARCRLMSAGRCCATSSAISPVAGQSAQCCNFTSSSFRRSPTAPPLVARRRSRWRTLSTR